MRPWKIKWRYCVSDRETPPNDNNINKNNNMHIILTWLKICRWNRSNDGQTDLSRKKILIENDGMTNKSFNKIRSRTKRADYRYEYEMFFSFFSCKFVGSIETLFSAQVLNHIRYDHMRWIFFESHIRITNLKTKCNLMFFMWYYYWQKRWEVQE